MSFGMAVLAWCAWRNRSIANAHAEDAASDDRAIDTVTITSQAMHQVVQGECFGDLLRHPLGRKVGRNIRQEPSVTPDKK
jgi:hypothetical protein